MATRVRHNLPLNSLGEPEVFDRAFLARYTMDCDDLEREIVELFLIQLPETLGLMSADADAAQWRFAAHTLKGSAGAVGARRLRAAAAALEDCVEDPEAKAIAFAEVESAISEFRAAVARAYSPR
jgi:HPt (histidine-containing phosphotransfer) domain-containing protein